MRGIRPGRLLWVPGILLALGVPARAAEIRDRAGMFDAGTVTQLQKELSQIERKYEVPVVIETIDALPRPSAEKAENRRIVNDLAVQHDRQDGNRGIFILLVKRDKLISDVLVPGWLARHVPESRRLSIRNAFIESFKKGDFNGGLRDGISAIDAALSTAQAEAGGSLRAQAAERVGGRPRAGARPMPPGRMPAPRPAGSPWGPLIGIVLVIFGIIVVIRILGSLFGSGAPMAGAQGRMGGPGGYMGPGYGGGGGGFMSSLFGGIGGAIAGNWLYDRFSGRHDGGGQFGSTGYDPAGSSPADVGGPADDEIVGGNDDGGMGGSWGDSGGGGGDWGGGGGDWGGGGGDGGGGGGDW
jgi:uncharacterized protein